MNTKQTGDIAEATILSEFVKLGCSVSIPFGENQKYDLIVDINGELLKVQCKSAWLEKDGEVLKFNVSSHYYNHSENKYVFSDYKGKIDLFAVYLPDNGKVYLVPESEVGKKDCTLRILPPKQNKKFNIAEDFEIQKQIKLL